MFSNTISIRFIVNVNYSMKKIFLSFFDVHLCLPVGVRRNFFRGAKTTFCLSLSAFRLLTMQHKLTNAKRFTVSAP